MKRNLLYILAVVILLLVACSDKSEKESVEDEDVVEEWSGGAELPEEDDEKEEEDAQVEKEVETLYEMDASWGFQPIDDADAQVVLVTIDDAPDNYALDMAKTLKELDVPAIFFLNGHFLKTDEEKENLKEIYDMGFQLGNHTETHANLQDLSEEEQREEILAVSDAVEEVVGERPIFFRAPHGLNTDFSRALVAEENMLLMNWSYGYDWEKEYMNADALTDIMVNTEFLRDGANLLMHDREWTAEALPGIIKGLQEKGFGFIDPLSIKGIE